MRARVEKVDVLGWNKYNLLVTNWNIIVLVYQVENDPRAIRLFPNVVMPECVAIFLINPQGIFNC